MSAFTTRAKLKALTKLTHFNGPIHKLTSRPKQKDKFRDLTNAELDSILEAPEGESRTNTTTFNPGKSYFDYSSENIDEYNESSDKMKIHRSTMNKHQLLQYSRASDFSRISSQTSYSPLYNRSKPQSHISDSVPEVKEGTLQKIKKSIFSEVLKARRCIIDNHCFKYYSGDILKGVIDFSIITAKIEYSLKRSSFRIKVENSLKCFDFLVPNTYNNHKQVRDGWLRAIHRIIISSNNSARKRLKLPMGKLKFWKFDRICEKTFLNTADTGDVLLFTTHNIGGQMQRFVTRSKFDHVAMVLKYSDGRIMMLEATKGVCICSWHDFVRMDGPKYYELVVHRKLFYTKRYNDIVKLEEYVKNVLGKRYNVNPVRLLTKYSLTDSIENLRDDKSFFCSELVASAYKCLGLLPKKIASSHYWPGSFSNENKLDLLDNAHLGDEQLIDFSMPC